MPIELLSIIFSWVIGICGIIFIPAGLVCFLIIMIKFIRDI